MRRSVWIGIGILSILAGMSLLVQAPEIFATRPPDKQMEFIFGTGGLVGLCGAIAIACFFPSSHPITLRLIGVIGITSCVYSMYDSFQDRDLVWVKIISRFILIFGFWGPFSIYLTIKGKMTDS